MEKVVVNDKRGSVAGALLLGGDDDDDDDLDHKIHAAEHSFVHKDFQQALHLANQVLLLQEQQLSPTSSSSSSSSSSSTRVKELQTRCFSGASVSLAFDTTIMSVADRAGALVLQSHQEASLKDEAMLEPFFQYYSTSPIPLEMFCIFIQFLLHSDKQHVAIELASEALCDIMNSSSTTNTTTTVITDELQEAMDELVWIFVTKMLPYCPDERYVNYFSDDDEATQQWQPSTASKRLKCWRKDPVPSILSTTLITLNYSAFRDICSKECIEQCQERLRELSGGGGGGGDAVLSDNTVVAANDEQLQMITTPLLRRNKTWLDTIMSSTRQGGGGYRLIAKQVLQLMTERIIKPLLYPESGDNYWEKRRQVALTIFSIYVAWKQRRRLLSVTSIIASVVLKPLQEIMDAVLPAGE
jgi:hypothetical protein